MRKIAFAVLLVQLAALTALPAPAQTPSRTAPATPRGIIRFIYSHNGQLLDFETILARFGSHTLHHYRVMESQCDRASEGICVFDYDPLTQDQGGGTISAVRMEAARQTATGLRIRVHFHNSIDAEDKVLDYLFVRENKAWKIDDVGGMKKTYADFFAKFDENGKPRAAAPQ